MCGNHLLADNFYVATHQPGPHIIPGSEMAAFKCFFNKLPLQECTASYSLLLSYHLSICWIPKAFLLNGEKLHWAKPCQEKRKRLEFSPSRPALVWSILGCTADSLLAGLDLEEGCVSGLHVALIFLK